MSMSNGCGCDSITHAESGAPWGTDAMQGTEKTESDGWNQFLTALPEPWGVEVTSWMDGMEVEVQGTSGTRAGRVGPGGQVS